MEEQPSSTGAEQPAAPISPTPTTHTDTDADSDSGGKTVSRMPHTNAEWTAFAALPPSERAEVAIRSLRAATAVVATLAVAAPVAAIIFAMPSLRAHVRPVAIAQFGR